MQTYRQAVLEVVQQAGLPGILSDDLIVRVLGRTGRRSAWGVRAALTQAFHEGLLAKRFEFVPHRGNPYGRRVYRYWLAQPGMKPNDAEVERYPVGRASTGGPVKVWSRDAGEPVPPQVSELEERARAGQR